MDNSILKLHGSLKTVFTSKELALIWGETSPNKLKTKIYYYTKKGYLFRLWRGVYAKTMEYNSRELATSLYSPSYISFETVLRDAGMIFQHYETIFVAAPWSKNLQIGKNKFAFRRLKKSVLYNPAGVINKDNFSIALPERAFLDTIYLLGDYYFDNLDSLDWKKCFEMAEIYQSKQLVKHLRIYEQKYAQ
ncbi:hypothetical protein J7J13_01335 [bacterium]|nr:hypothetical protein [bacterium]